jgi:hypothetical protein
MITLGRFDIHYATGVLARFCTALSQGHAKAMHRVLGYLKKYPHVQILVDPALPDHTQYTPIDQDWTEFYLDTS